MKKKTTKKSSKSLDLAPPSLHNEMTVREMARMGGKARIDSMTPEELSKANSAAALARWSKLNKEQRLECLKAAHAALRKKREK